ncbi:MAG: hypothetical protein IKQ22_00805 [Clostridia bacterium]|nr:hypothetical protein [Clostridia bacterium]
MDKYTIVVMDYESGSLRFYYFDKEPKDPEAWLESHDANWSDSTCYWMGVKGHNVNEDHVYGADNMEEVPSTKCRK